MSAHHTKPGWPGDILEHHGIKGMKWGDRKQEETSARDSAGRIVPKTVVSMKKPRPLSEKKQRNVEKFKKRSEVMGTKISDLKRENEALKGTKNPASFFKKLDNQQAIKNLDKAQKRAVRDAEATKQGKLTSKQKKLIIGAVGVTAIVGVTLAVRGQQSGATNSFMLRGAAFIQGRDTPFVVNKSLSGKMSVEDLLSKIAKPVNPGYATAGGQMNCRRSTFAYELRRRGFDVHATTSAVGWGQSESGVINALTTEGKDYFRPTSMSRSVVDTGFSSVATGDRRLNPAKKILLDGLRINPEEESRRVKAAIKAVPEGGDIMAAIRRSGVQSSSKNVLAELAKQPNGARGEVVFKFPSFGHSMAYEIVDGVPHIFDSQKGTLYNASHMVESKWDGFSAAEITRLDLADLDLNFLSRWAGNN